jgi:hypothetical protein
VISEIVSPVSRTALLSPVLATVTSHPEITAIVMVVPGVRLVGGGGSRMIVVVSRPLPFSITHRPYTPIVAPPQPPLSDLSPASCAVDVQRLSASTTAQLMARRMTSAKTATSAVRDAKRHVGSCVRVSMPGSSFRQRAPAPPVVDTAHATHTRHSTTPEDAPAALSQSGSSFGSVRPRIQGRYSTTCRAAPGPWWPSQTRKMEWQLPGAGGWWRVKMTSFGVKGGGGGVAFALTCWRRGLEFVLKILRPRWPRRERVRQRPPSPVVHAACCCCVTAAARAHHERNTAASAPHWGSPPPPQDPPLWRGTPYDTHLRLEHALLGRKGHDGDILVASRIPPASYVARWLHLAAVLGHAPQHLAH